jgi:hypothetical protein
VIISRFEWAAREPGRSERLHTIQHEVKTRSVAKSTESMRPSEPRKCE